MNTVTLACIFVGIVLNVSCSAEYSCYAPPMFWGPECRGTATFGRPGYNVYYKITSITGNVGTLVCCEGWSPEDSKYYSIGCGHDSFGDSVKFGNFLDYPTIKCKGVPFGTFLTWTH